MTQQILGMFFIMMQQVFSREAQNLRVRFPLSPQKIFIQ